MQINPRAPRSVLCVLVGALLLRPAGGARADEQKPPLPRLMRLDYHVPPFSRCPGPEEFEDLVVRNARRSVFDKDAPAVLWVKVSRRLGRHEVTFELRDAAGAVVFTEPVAPRVSCDNLAEALAFQVGETLKDPPAPPAPPPAPPPPPPVTVPKKETTVVKETTTKPRLWGVRGAVTGGVGLGVSPALAAGVFTFELGGQRKITPNVMLSGALGALWSPRGSALTSLEMSQAKVEAGTTLFTGVATLCAHRRLVFPWAFGCAGLEVGRLGASAADTASGRSADRGALWLAFAPRLGVEVPLPQVSSRRIPRFAALAFGDAVVPLLRTRINAIEGPAMSSGTRNAVWTTPLVSGAFHLGVLAWYDL